MTTLVRRLFGHCKTENAQLTLDDKAWIDGVTTLVRSHTAFLLAQFRGDADLVDRAANVLIWRDGRFSTVRELVDVCASHGWNSTIYEAWTWETGQRVRRLMRSLDETAVQAVEVYARQQGYFDVGVCEMEGALQEAREALEGTP